MPTPTDEGRYFCESCTARYDDRGDCPKCPEEPLQDLLDEDVLLMLQSFDDQRWQKRMGMVSLASGVICLPILICIPLRKIGFLAYGAAVMGLSGAAITVFPPHKKTPDMGQVH